MASLEQNFPVEHKNPSMRWRIAVSRLRSEAEAKRKKESIQVRSFKKEIIQVRSFKNESLQADISTGVEEISEIQPCSHSPATSPDKYYSCPEAESDDDRALLRSETDHSDRNFTSTGGQHVSPAHVNHDPLRRSKIEVLELIFFLANFIVELMSIVFDQLSSQHKHKDIFLLMCLIMSILAVLISIFELLYKLIKERATEKRGWRRCLFDPPSGARVGFFPCITALTCAFGQLIINTVNYSLYRKHGNAPIKISIWSTIFAFGQLVSSLSFRGAKTEVIGNQARV